MSKGTKSRFRTSFNDLQRVAMIINQIKDATHDIHGLTLEIINYDDCTEVIVVDTMGDKRSPNELHNRFLQSEFYIDTQTEYDP